MKTAEQIKGAIRNISKETGTNPNSLLQMCLFEGILEKLSKSKQSCCMVAGKCKSYGKNTQMRILM